MNLAVLSNEQLVLNFHSPEVIGGTQLSQTEENLKVFEFPEMHAGQCICIAVGIKLYLFQNGYYVIGGKSQSGHSNAVWNFKIDLLTEPGAHLDKIPVYYETWGHHMSTANVWYNWNIKEFEFEVGSSRLARVFNDVHHIKMLYNC